ncbi:MAG: chromosome segregation protein SMC [Acidimicrobiia bacterium]
MYLRSLRLAGFKSFADRTRLEFEPGVTVVVGPNGSGKSNLVEAVAWVMGTQAPSSVRTQRMDDLIFAGTATRPALGRAEASLTFDNRSRQLPLDLEEVTITRRLYRDGTSVYQINGADCRLLDIQELLADSGVGRQQHVIVAQGRLDEILNASPEDHRAIIEEAAGVLKHRLRKERAVRRLERTDDDLVRLHDILRELRRQMRPLRRQAEAAERHEGVRAEARALRLFLGGEELRRIDGRLRELDGLRSSFAAGLSEAEEEAGALEESLGDLEAAAGEAGRALDRDTVAAARLETAGERLRRIEQVAQERRRALEARLEGTGERREDLEAEARDLESELAASAREERSAGREAEQREGQLRELEDEERSLAEQEALPPEGAAAVVRGELQALETAAERDAREAQALAHRLEVVRSLAEEEGAEVGRLGADVRVVDGLAAQAQDAYQAARAERQTAQESWDAAQEAVGEARLALTGAQARLDALGGVVPVLPDGVATLSQFLEVGELIPAVRAALGPWADALAVGNRAAVEDLAARLKSEGLGGVAVVSAEGEDAPVPARLIAEQWGLPALIDCIPEGPEMSWAASLLGDVILAEGWGAAWQLVERHPEIRVVTPEGDLVTAQGIRLAGTGDHEPGRLESLVEECEVSLARAQSRATTTHRDFERARERERIALECLESLETRIAGASEALARLERGRSSAEAEIVRLEERYRSLLGEGTSREVRAAVLRERLTALEGEEATRQAAWETLARRRSGLVARREQARRLREEAASSLAAVVERRRLLEKRLSEVRAELGDVVDRPVDPARPARLADIERQAREALALVLGHVSALRDRQWEGRRVSGEAGSRLTKARARLGDLRRSIEENREHLSVIAVESAELHVRREAEAEALRRDIDGGEAAALAAPRPELPEAVPPADRLESLQAELRRMGPVNPLAAAEYRELAERSEFLESQLADLEASRAELRKVIRGLEDQMVELFLAAYHEVAGHFEESLRILFPGGRGELRLTDPNDPLETGVEIQAQPLGKKVVRLSLLSGGERSLASLAFLFAVFKARPSPFYILDEVDAALDDANLRRFLRLVDQLRGTAQLIVVTHQQQTMEAADILYGVTMEPGASSQVVAKRMAEVELSA